MIVDVGFGGPRAPFALALTSGVITAFNPCGFAMLPAYVSVFVGRSETRPDSTARRLLRAATAGTIVTLGFVTVFGAIGLLTTQLLSTITDFVPYISMIVGTFLALLGVAMLCGLEPKMSFFTVRRAQRGRTWRSMYLYGVSYAVVSLSCGFAGFLTTVVAASRESSFATSMSVYAAFSAGMGLVLVVLSVAVALAQQAFVRAMRRVLPFVNRASGGMLMLSGLYVAYYGYYEWTTIVRGRSAPAGPIAWVEAWSSAVSRGVSALPLPTAAASMVVAVGAIAIGAHLGRTTRARRTTLTEHKKTEHKKTEQTVIEHHSTDPAPFPRVEPTRAGA